MFSFVLGNTYLSISTIVASFMFGLFLGAWLIGKVIAKINNPLRWYAYLEGLIGCYAIILLISFSGVDVWFEHLYKWLSPLGPIHGLSRFLSTLLLILVPTSAMGATLPLAVQYFTRGKKIFGDNISLFYAVNTIGGAMGALWAGFYLIEHLGIRHSVIFTAAINLLIGIVVLITTHNETSPIKDVEPALKKAKKTKITPAFQEWKSLYLLAAGLAGFAALSYEIIWTRALKFLIHNSTYSFSVMLFVFLLGIGIGSHIARKLLAHKGRDLHYLYGVLQVGLAIYAIFTIYLMYSFAYSDFFQLTFVDIIYDFSYSWVWGIVIYTLICCIMFLLPTILMGILFPVINELYFEHVEKRAGTTVSTIYAINTIGSILGSVVAGFFLLPVLGIKTSLLLISSINLFLGIIFIVKASHRLQPTMVTGGLLLVVVFSLSLNGKYLYGRKESKLERVLFYKEGLMATVKVFQQNDFLSMSIDGNKIASTERTLFRKEKLIAHLPFFVKPDIKNVLVVGLASGISTGCVALHQEVEAIDCVELIKPVFPAATLFRDFNYNIFANPKVNLIYDDIYGFLKYRDKKYDLIVSDGKLGPLYSGNTIMLAYDYYQLCKNRMQPDGVFIQWLPIITPFKELDVVLQTLKASFNYVLLFYFYPTDIFMLASDNPMILDKKVIEQVFQNRLVAQDLAPFGVKSFREIFGSFVGSYELPNGEAKRINTFDKPITEFEYMREWKKGKLWPGGYRALNVQYLLENYVKMDLESIFKLTKNIDKESLQELVKGSRLFFKGCIMFFKTGNFQESFREYRAFQKRSKLL